MEGNLLIEQFGRYKKLELEMSPFHFLLDANIELNPHQINAFCAAVQALKRAESYWLTRSALARP